MEAIDGCVLDRALQSLKLPIGPKVIWLGEAVFDPVDLTDRVETYWPGIRGVSVLRLLGELNAIVGEDGV